MSRMDEASLRRARVKQRRRPTWTIGSGYQGCLVSSREMRRWMIAKMYWLENKTAPEIAAHFSITENAVRKILGRMAAKEL